MTEPIINQPWEDVASDVTEAIEKAVQPLLRKATDEIYAGLLDTTQDYLRDNLAFNITERINAAERQAYVDRIEAERLRDINATLLAGLRTKRDYVADAASGALTYADSGDGFIAMAKEDLARIDAAIAKATGAGA